MLPEVVRPVAGRVVCRESCGRGWTPACFTAFKLGPYQDFLELADGFFHCVSTYTPLYVSFLTIHVFQPLHLGADNLNVPVSGAGEWHASSLPHS